MDKKEITVGIDIGGTNTVIGFIDTFGNCLAEAIMPTQANEPAGQFIPRLSKELNNIYCRKLKEYTLIGIGVAAPSANIFKGTIEYPSNLNWGKVDFLTLMKKHFDVPVVITNDANAAALGEQAFGAAKGMNNFIVLTLGTGVGSGIVVDGNLLYGENGLAGELGHTSVETDGRVCSCGKVGCLEAYISGNGLRRTVFSFLGFYNDETELRNISFSDLTAEMVSELARQNDPLALKVFDYTGKILGRKLADVVANFSPEAIILFGGLANSGELLLEPTRCYFNENLLSIHKNKVKILSSELQNGRAAVLGAHILILKELRNRSC